MSLLYKRKFDKKAISEYKRMLKKIKESEETNGQGNETVSPTEEVLRETDETGAVHTGTPVSDGDTE